MQEVQFSVEEIGAMFAAAKRMASRYRQIGLMETDDIVQTSMLKLLKKKNNGMKPTLAWLYRVVQNTAMDAVRGAARQRRYVEHDLDTLVISELTDQYGFLRFVGSCKVDDEHSEIDLLPRLKAMLAKLSKPLSQVLVLSSQGYSYEEMARLTNTNIGTVRSRLHNARRQARAILGDSAVV